MKTADNRDGSVGWGLAAIVATAAVYLALLGWRAEKTLDPATGRETGPYEPWQVIVLAIVIAILAAIMGWRRRALLAVGTIPVTLATLFAIDAVTGTESDGLWAVGALLVLVGSAVGVATVALLAQRLR